MRNYAICAKCIMDTSAPNISFNSKNICNYCTNYEINILPTWSSDLANKEKILALSESIKRSTHNDEFNCIIGLSEDLIVPMPHISLLKLWA